MKKLFLLIIMIFGLSGCASAKDSTRLVLRIPVGFKGAIYLAGDPKNGQDPQRGQIQVPSLGLVFVKSLADVATIRPDAFIARDSRGKKLGNSILQTGKETSLWPIEYVDNEFLCFFIGTFHEKTVFENIKMTSGWDSEISWINNERRGRK